MNMKNTAIKAGLTACLTFIIGVLIGVYALEMSIAKACAHIGLPLLLIWFLTSIVRVLFRVIDRSGLVHTYTTVWGRKVTLAGAVKMNFNVMILVLVGQLLGPVLNQYIEHAQMIFSSITMTLQAAIGLCMIKIIRQKLS